MVTLCNCDKLLMCFHSVIFSHYVLFDFGICKYCGYRTMAMVVSWKILPTFRSTIWLLFVIIVCNYYTNSTIITTNPVNYNITVGFPLILSIKPINCTNIHVCLLYHLYRVFHVWMVVKIISILIRRTSIIE